MKDSSPEQTVLIGRKAFPRSVRLLKPHEFKRVFSKSIASSDRYFKILARPNGGSSCRLGLAVSRKVDRHAVGRNRIKRVIRESFRHRFGTAPAGFGQTAADTAMDLVVLPRPLCATICNRQLRASLETHWTRLNKSCEKTRPHQG